MSLMLASRSRVYAYLTRALMRTRPRRYEPCTRLFSSLATSPSVKLSSELEERILDSVLGRTADIRPALASKNHAISPSAASASRVEESTVTYPSYIAHCPREAGVVRNFYCSECPKVFSSRKYLNVHMLCHSTRHRFECAECNSRFVSKEGLRRHEESHGRRATFACPVCFDEFRQEAQMLRHLEAEPADHKAKRQPLVVDESLASATHFSHPKKVVGNRFCHITTPERRDAIERDLFLEPGRVSDRVHDGPLRLDSAPQAAFGVVQTREKAIHNVGFHPVHAEPGERTSLLAVDLNTFAREPGQYRLFIASMSRPPGANPYGTRESNVRATLLFMRSFDTEYSAWADQQNLLELDINDNPIFSWKADEQAWYGATRYYPLGDLAVGGSKGPSGSVNLVVAVAGGLPYSDSDAEWVDCAKIGKVDGKLFCPTCGEAHTDFRSLFGHLQTSTAASGPRSVSARNRVNDSESERGGANVIESSKFSCTKTFRMPESVLQKECFAYVSLRTKELMRASGHVPAASWSEHSPAHFLTDQAAHTDTPIDSHQSKPTFVPCEFHLAPWSDGQIFPFSTLPPASTTKTAGDGDTKGGSRTALLTLSLEELLCAGSSVGSGDDNSTPSHRKVFARIEASGVGNFRTFTAQLAVAASPAKKHMLESKGYSLVDLSSNRFLWRSPSGRWRMATHVCIDDDHHLYPLRLSIVSADDVALSSLRHTWRDSMKLHDARVGSARSLACPHSASCGEDALSSLASVRDHYRAEHLQPGDAVLACEKTGCSFSTKTSSSLRRHLRSKHDRRATQYRCEVESCSFTTIWPRNLKQHLATHATPS